MSELWKLSASAIVDAVKSRKLTAVDVTTAHLDRLAVVNPALNAVVQQFPEEALGAARAVDAQIANGEDPGPLGGVPVTIKVNADQAGHATTNGLKILKDLVATSDSPVVSNIKKAGGIIVGRTNTPAFSLRWFTNNDLHGQTLNPHAKDITPGGSSGGAAAAVASGICAIGHGTDIGGSIRYPAYACGLHGLRPTLGRIPAYNASMAERHIGAQLMAVSGPIARTMDDIALALKAMCKPDPRDPWSVPAPIDLGAFPKRAALTIAPEGMPVVREVKDALLNAAQKLEANGWTVEEVPCPPMREAADLNAKLWMGEMRYGAKEMIAKEAEANSMWIFDRMTTRSPDIDMPGLLNALQARAGLVREWSLFLQKYPVLLCPVSGQLPFLQQYDVSSQQNFENAMEAQLTQLAIPLLGLPGLAVSTGFAGKTPVGVQLIAGRYREDILLAAGASIERNGHRPGVIDPQF
jgi:amidase